MGSFPGLVKIQRMYILYASFGWDVRFGRCEPRKTTISAIVAVYFVFAVHDSTSLAWWQHVPFTGVDIHESILILMLILTLKLTLTITLLLPPNLTLILHLTQLLTL